MSTTPSNDPRQSQIDAAVNAATTNKRPGWLWPLVGLLVIALLGGAYALVSKKSDAPASTTSGTAAQAPANGSARTLEQIKSAGSIKIGVFSDKAPFGSVDANGAYVGYDVEYAQRIAKDLGVKLELVPVEAASRVEFLTSGKVDVILANFTVTPERAQKVDFAKPYMKVSLGVVSPKSAPITDVKQLAAKKTIVVKGTTAETYLAKEHAELETSSFEQYTEATNALLDGRGAAWVTDNTEALAFSINNQQFTTGITTLGPTDTIAAAVQKGNSTLLDWLNQQLVTLGKEKFFHADFEKTLKPAYGDAAKADDLVVEGGQA